MKRFHSFLFAIPLATLAGCSNLAPIETPVAPEIPSFGASKPAPTTKPALVASASATKRVFKAGQPVELKISLKNISDEPIELELSSGQNFDFQAFKAGQSEPVWRWSEGRMFTMMVRNQTLKPGELLDFGATWENAPIGRYQIEGKITANGGIVAPRFEIEVR